MRIAEASARPVSLRPLRRRDDASATGCGRAHLGTVEVRKKRCARVHAWAKPLLPYLPWLVFLHVLSVLAFLLVHGGAAAAMLRLRHEREMPRVQTLLRLSESTRGPMWGILMALGITGLALTLIEHTYARFWIWGSVLVLVLMQMGMHLLATQPLNDVRKAAGLSWYDGKGEQLPVAPDERALAIALARMRPAATALVGGVGLVVLLWMMMLRPG